MNIFKVKKGKLNIIDIISEPNIYYDEDTKESETLDDRKNLDELKQRTKYNYKLFLKIRLYTFISDLIDKDIFAPSLEQMIKIIQESYEKMINEKKLFGNIENKSEKAKENINKLFNILSSNLDDKEKTLLENKINNIKNDIITYYNDKKDSIFNNFDEKRTLQESMKKNIIEAYEKKPSRNKPSMDKYIESITDHLITPIATNTENYCFYFIFCLFREDIINCIVEEISMELRNKKKQLDENTKEYIDKLAYDFLK